MATKRLDSWLILVIISRIALYANFMVWAACLPILLSKWDMSATQAAMVDDPLQPDGGGHDDIDFYLRQNPYLIHQ